MQRNMNKIICLGDSIVYGYGVPRHLCWVRLAAEQTGLDLVNRGVSGDTALGMLSRLERDVFSASPDAVLIMGGANDIVATGSADTARNAVFAMVQQARTNGIVPIVGIPTPIHPPVREDWAAMFHTESFVAAYEAYFDWLRAFAKALDLKTLDFGAAFLPRIRALGGRTGDYYQSDGLHPNAAAQQILAELFCSVLLPGAAREQAPSR